MKSRKTTAVVGAGLLFTGFAITAFGDVIDFESQCPSGVQASGPCSPTFASAGNAQTLSISTGIGIVTFQGGVTLDQTTKLPADETAIYGTAGNTSNIGVSPGTGFTNPLAITFPVPISNFFLDVLNGNVINVNYQVADNTGNSANFLLVPNLSSGLKTIGFAATGTVVTIDATTGQSTPDGRTFDYFIDNIHFDESLPAGLSTPEPSLLSVLMAGLGAVVFFRHRAAYQQK